jgi:Putative zinc-finger
MIKSLSRSLSRSMKTTVSDLGRKLGRCADFDCRRAEAVMSAYIDSMCSEEESRRLRAHVASCPPCRRQLQGYVSLRGFMARVPAPEVPPELALETRIRLSHARTDNALGQLGLRVSNSLKPRMVPALAGGLAALACFVVLLGAFGAVLGRPSDPADPAMWALTQARPRGPLMVQLTGLGLDDLTLTLNIDQKGKVAGGEFRAGSATPEVDQWIKDVVLLADFYPATLYGQPVQSPLVLQFVGVKSGPPSRS